MLYFILIIAAIVRSIGLNQSLWLDEAAQVIESARPLGAQLDIVADFQPPLFHLLLHFWMYLGRSEVWLRLLPVVIGVATVFATYKLVRELTTEKVALLTAWLLSISPFHIWYSQEVRPYALAALLGIISTYYLIRKQYMRYTVSAILLVYSMYLTPFLLVAHGIYVIIWERRRLQTWLIAMVVVVVGFLPWLPQFLRQLAIGTGFTHTLPGWDEAVSTPIYKILPLIFIKFILGRITIDNKLLYAILSLGLFAGFGYLCFSAAKHIRGLFFKLVVFGIVPLGLGLLITLFIPILAPQRLIYLLPFFYAVIALGMKALSQRALQVMILVILLIISSASLFLYWGNPRFQREKWREAVQYVEDNRTNNALAIFVFPAAFAPWQWYSHGVVPAVGVAPEFVVTDQDLETYSTQIGSAERIYYFHYLADLTDPLGQTEKFLRDHGYLEVQKKDFPGVGFVSVYEKAMAGI